VAGSAVPSTDDLVAAAQRLLHDIREPSLQSVINATGVILHTNLGRAPLGAGAAREAASLASGYSNLEFDLEAARRGRRITHVRKLLKYLTGAEDVLVVNNNAAGVVLALSVLAGRGEAIVSRGELIEIGGSFRLPDIMAASGVKMVEVGTSNRTRISDYENAITADTELLFKAHRSNFSVSGFVEEASVRRLAELAGEKGIPLLYDMGSGLLRKPKGLPLEGEPDVSSAIADGADLVAFSCDKLLGGPQAGIVAGRARLIAKLSKAPLMRALRVCKMTMAALRAVCREYLNEESLFETNPTLGMLSRKKADLEKDAQLLLDALAARDVKAERVDNIGRCGGGALPDLELDSVAVEIPPPKGARKSEFSEDLFKRLLALDRPILGILREGRILFDVLTLAEKEIPYVAEAVASALKHVHGP